MDFNDDDSFVQGMLDTVMDDVNAPSPPPMQVAAAAAVVEAQAELPRFEPAVMPPLPLRPQQRSSAGKLTRPSRAAAPQTPPRARAPRAPRVDIYEVEPTPEPRATAAAPPPLPPASSRGSPHSRTEFRCPEYITEEQ
ncbi:hypothetical protein LTR37_013865 [Vermiconidia calcicola]|uniref:Uncharacterized protein n=1 Tax=Vermiconidia calcicola TaxID=1690605 RepID=A0ACC3MWT3_9PEZI|nr:hypothetical protein LTR37_013865 [Vermiconidia calcicola]